MGEGWDVHSSCAFYGRMCLVCLLNVENVGYDFRETPRLIIAHRWQSNVVGQT